MDARPPTRALPPRVGDVRTRRVSPGGKRRALSRLKKTPRTADERHVSVRTTNGGSRRRRHWRIGPGEPSGPNADELRLLINDHAARAEKFGPMSSDIDARVQRVLQRRWQRLVVEQGGERDRELRAGYPKEPGSEHSAGRERGRSERTEARSNGAEPSRRESLAADAASFRTIGVAWRAPETLENNERHRGVEVELEAVERGQRGHVDTETALVGALREAGIEPLSPGRHDPNFDLAWGHEDQLWVAVVKSIRSSNEERQLRLGLGQVLAYRSALRRPGDLAVQAVLVPERTPRDGTWSLVCAGVGVLLIPREHFAQLRGVLTSARRQVP